MAVKKTTRKPAVRKTTSKKSVKKPATRKTTKKTYSLVDSKGRKLSNVKLTIN